MTAMLRAFTAPRLVSAALAALCTVAAGAGAAADDNRVGDAEAAFQLRRDLLSYQLSRGASPAQACASLVRYVGGHCGFDDGVFAVSEMQDGVYSFYLRIEIDSLR